MSSFKRKSASSPGQKASTPGTRISQSNSQVLLTSTGIPSLDDILGGGLQLGTDLLLLNPDPHSSHAALVQKYFISQGLATGHEIHIFDSDAEDLVASCMWKPEIEPSLRPVQAPYDDELEEVTSEGDKVKIAWRYERMDKYKTTVPISSTNDDFCAAFDLSCKIPPTVVEHALKCGKLSKHDVRPEECIYETMVYRIKDVLANAYDQPEPSSTAGIVMRLVISSFGGPSWGDPSPQKIISFLVKLRSLLRNYPLACAVLALPSHLSNASQRDSSWSEKLGWVSDACISLDSVSADPSMAVVLPSHHGLVRIISLPRVQMLVPSSDRSSSLRGISASISSPNSGGVGENNLAFKCTRRRLVFETFHLDVEGGVGERRTTPATSSVLDNAHESKRQDPTEASSTQATAALQVEVEKATFGIPPGGLQAPAPENGERPKPRKKVLRKVGFQTDKPDIYDF